jgi:hypothetical protein
VRAGDGPQRASTSAACPTAGFGFALLKARVVIGSHPVTDRVLRGHANRTSRVYIGKADSPMYQTIEVGCVDVRVGERSDGIESLLIRHDEQHIRPGWMTFS